MGATITLSDGSMHVVAESAEEVIEMIQTGRGHLMPVTPAGVGTTWMRRSAVLTVRDEPAVGSSSH
jgi:hypothetical protein